jgi:cytidylate kinase
MPDHISEIAELANDNVRKWMLAECTHARLARGKVDENVGPYVIISRETGAGGSEIARLVGEKLGWDVLDREIIDYIADKFGTSRSLVEFVDEKRANWIHDVFTTWIEGQDFTQAAYLHRLIRLLLLAAHHGKVVIVGRGAQFILPRNRGLSVRIIAPIEFRIEQVILQRGLGAHDARKFIENSDRQRQEFIKTYFRHKCADPHTYDLVIKLENLVRKDAVNLIVAAVHSWLKESDFTV